MGRREGIAKKLLERDKFWQRQRPTYLPSHLVKCGEGGGGCSKVSLIHYSCSTARNKGTCTNRRRAAPIPHPSMAERYRKEVTRLVESLNDERHRAEAAILLRKRVDKVVLKPDPDGPGILIDLYIDLYGDLAGIPTIAAAGNKNQKKQDEVVMNVLIQLWAAWQRRSPKTAWPIRKDGPR